MGFLWLFEDREGRVYAASVRNVYLYRPGVAPGELPSWVERWKEHLLAACHPVRDSEGNIWMFLEDHPGQVSRWDGQHWTHMEFPYPSGIISAMSDD